MPTNMPGFGFSALDITPNLGRTFARSEGGMVISSSHADPFWRGEMETRGLDMGPPNNEHARFLAWLNWACDLNMRVDFVHPVHKLPSAYTVDTWPMIGNATLGGISDLRTIAVSGLVVGMTLRQGDRLSIMQGDIIIHRWFARDLVVDSTISQTLELTPRLPIGVLAPGAAVVLRDPKMRFMIVPNSWSSREVAREECTISFEVQESLR